MGNAPLRTRPGPGTGSRAIPARRGPAGVPMRRRRRDGGPAPPSRQAAGSAPLGPGRAQAPREGARPCQSRDGRAAFRSAGVISAAASLAPAPWGGPGAGSRYHCSVVAATEVRSRRAAGSGPLRPGRAEAAGQSAPTPSGPLDGRLFRSSTGLILARACPAPSGYEESGRGPPHSKKRRHSSAAIQSVRGVPHSKTAVAAAEVRSCQAADAGPLRPRAAEAASEGARRRRRDGGAAFLLAQVTLPLRRRLGRRPLWGPPRGRVALPRPVLAAPEMYAHERAPVAPRRNTHGRLVPKPAVPNYTLEARPAHASAYVSAMSDRPPAPGHPQPGAYQL